MVWRNLGWNPDLPDHWQTLYPLSQWARKLKSIVANKFWVFIAFSHGEVTTGVWLKMLHYMRITCKPMKSCSYKIIPTKYSFRNLWLNVYTYRQNLALNNLQRLICHKTQITNQTNYMHKPVWTRDVANVYV